MKGPLNQVVMEHQPSLVEKQLSACRKKAAKAVWENGKTSMSAGNRQITLQIDAHYDWPWIWKVWIEGSLFRLGGADNEEEAESKALECLARLMLATKI